ncbi:MAG: zinc-ribbon domain-containing protein [Dehalococcoidia bacterium]|nr:zinc-ribbon domain-containing protein [Dehalococcoidia bacterium]
MRCSSCGRDNPTDAAFCANCGFAFTFASPPHEGPTPPLPVVPSALVPSQAPAATFPRTYAGFWIRLVAAIVDSLILGVVNGFISFASPALPLGGTA